MELDPEERVLEVLHELLVVNPLAAIDVSHLCNRDNFTVAELNLSELFKAVFVFQWLQEALIILIVVSEHLEQRQVFIFWHLNLIRLEYTELDKLRLSSDSLSGEMSLDKRLKLLSKL